MQVSCEETTLAARFGEPATFTTSHFNSLDLLQAAYAEIFDGSKAGVTSRALLNRGYGCSFSIVANLRFGAGFRTIEDLNIAVLKCELVNVAGLSWPYELPRHGTCTTTRKE